MAVVIWKNRAIRKVVLGSAGVLFLTFGGLWLVDPEDYSTTGPFTQAEESELEEGEKTPTSAAEVIARLQHSLEIQQKYLNNLNAQLRDPNSEFYQAEKSFQRVDAELEATRQAIRELQAAGKTAEAAKRQAALKDINERWQQERDRFDTAIKERKALEENIAAATRQLRLDQEALDRLSNNSTDDPAPPPSTSPAPAASPLLSPPETQGIQAKPQPAKARSASSARTGKAKGGPSSTPGQPAAQPSALPIAGPIASALPISATKGTAAQPADHVSREVERARQDAKVKEEAAQKAENNAKNITERIEALNANIGRTKTLLEAARERAVEAQKTKAELEGELRQKRAAMVSEAELHDLSNHIDATQKRFEQALAEVRSTTDYLHDLQTELSQIQAAQIRALREANAKKHDAEAAEEKIAELQNPFRPRNMVQWLLHHGPRLLLVAAGMFVLNRLTRVLSRRIVQFMADGLSKRGSYKDRENRAQTLAGVFNSALSLLILGGGTLMILDEVGIPIVPLMGGAAVIGLAVAFGAQNLIKDYFSGFMVLLEDQYGINDVVKIGDISGLVEHISLRTTVLRDLEGIVHFVPHGTITTVSNMTHGWSRALFDVGIDYKENADRVMQVLLDIGHQMRLDPVFGPLILDDPEMLGVDQFSESSVIIKFFVKTKPLQQWTIKREMLRRIKKRFDELGIEIPYPHQTVHHRYDAPPPAGMPASPEIASGRRVA